MGSLEARCELGTGSVKTRLSEIREGTSRANGQRVAVQITPIDAASRESVERTLERATRALTAGKVRGLGEIVDWDVEEERYWIAFAYAGAPLASILERGVARETIVDIGLEVAAGLRALKQAGLVHRAINPSVVFVTPEGRATLLGLEGVRAVGSPDVLRAAVSVNDPQYTPPEAAQYESDDIRSDVWSLGAVLYRAVAGKPFDGSNTNVPGEPATSGWNALFARLLAKQPAERPYPEDIELLLKPLRFAGAKLADLSLLKASTKERSVPVFAIFAVVVGVLALGMIMFAINQGGGIATIAGENSVAKPSASASPSAGASGASATPATSASATAAPTAVPGGGGGGGGGAPPPRTPAPTAPPPPPPPAADTVTPFAGPQGTIFHFVITGLPPSETWRSSYTHGSITVGQSSGEVPANGQVVIDLRTTTGGTTFPPADYTFTVRAAGVQKNVPFRIVQP